MRRVSIFGQGLLGLWVCIFVPYASADDSTLDNFGTASVGLNKQVTEVTGDHDLSGSYSEKKIFWGTDAKGQFSGWNNRSDPRSHDAALDTKPSVMFTNKSKTSVAINARVDMGLLKRGSTLQSCGACHFANAEKALAFVNLLTSNDPVQFRFYSDDRDLSNDAPREGNPEEICPTYRLDEVGIKFPDGTSKSLADYVRPIQPTDLEIFSAYLKRHEPDLSKLKTSAVVEVPENTLKTGFGTVSSNPPVGAASATEKAQAIRPNP